MIYIFALFIVIIAIKQKDEILENKKGIVLFLCFVIISFSLGILYELNPYLPSIAALIRQTMR